jgi:hypothetical protein
MNEDVQTTAPRCCGGGDFYGHEPFCDCGHVLAEKATASYIDGLRAALKAAEPWVARAAGVDMEPTVCAGNVLDMVRTMLSVRLGE